VRSERIRSEPPGGAGHYRTRDGTSQLNATGAADTPTTPDLQWQQVVTGLNLSIRPPL